MKKIPIPEDENYKEIAESIFDNELDHLSKAHPEGEIIIAELVKELVDRGINDFEAKAMIRQAAREGKIYERIRGVICKTEDII